MVSACTKSSFSTVNVWWRPPSFSFISTTSCLPSGMVNFGRQNTVRSDCFPRYTDGVVVGAEREQHLLLHAVRFATFLSTILNVM